MKSPTSLQILDLLEENARLKRELEKLSQQAQTDELTGLLNRRALDSQFEQMVRKSIQSKRPLAVIFWDIDDFKYINDTLGHNIGDAVLLEFGRLLKSLSPANCHIARVGGDEFVMVLPNHCCMKAKWLADEIRQSINSNESFQRLPFPLSASYGIAICSKSLNTADALYRAADRAMYANKFLP